MTVTPADLGTYLGAAIDPARAQYLIDQATNLCQSILTPLPAGADAVVLDVAVRAYNNPGNVSSQGMGPFNASYGTAGGGLYLTRQNKVTLRRLGGSGSAYSIDVTPPNHAKTVQGLPFWDWDPAAFRAANPDVPDTGSV